MINRWTNRCIRIRQSKFVRKKCRTTYWAQNVEEAVVFVIVCLCNQWLSPLKLWVRVPIWRGVLVQHYVIMFVSD